MWEKMSSTCWRTRISGWMRPIGTSRPGSVTSTPPAGGRDDSRAERFSSSAASISPFRVLTSLPNSGRSSAGIDARLLKSPVTDPDLRLRNSSASAFNSRSEDADASRV